MNRKVLKIFSFFIALSMCITMISWSNIITVVAHAVRNSVYENCTEGLEFEIIDEYAFISGYHGTETNIVVGLGKTINLNANAYYSHTPKIDGYEVRGIKNNAFTDNPTIETFTCCINGYIGDEAFKNCDNLKEANICISYSSIGESAFEGCDSLTELRLYAYNSVVNKKAFFDNRNLQYLVIDSAYTTLEEMAFANCTNLQMPYLNETDCLNIGDWAFANCYSIEYIEAHVSSIGDYSFSGCSALKEVKFTSPTTSDMRNYIIRSIGYGAFANCDIEYAYLPENISTIPDNAFLNNDNIKFQVEENSTTKKSLDKLNAEYFSDYERMNYSKGSGTPSDPYMITNYYQLLGIGKDSDSLTKFYKLANDICVPYSWNIIGNELNPFKGTFDGDYHKIYNVGKLRDNVKYGGIFGYIDGAYIVNLIVESASVTSSIFPTMCMSASRLGTVYYGAIVGKGVGDNCISNCAVLGDLKFYSSYYAEGIVYGGCIAGDYSGIIEKCYFEGTLYSTSDGWTYNGALIGRGNCNINNCYADVTYTGMHGFTINSYTYIYTGEPFGGCVENSYVYMNETTAEYLNIAGGKEHVTIQIPDESKFINSYWTSDDSIFLNADMNPVTSRSYDEMKQQSTFESWDFDTIWTIDEGNDLPKLRWYADNCNSDNGTYLKLNAHSQFLSEGDAIAVTANFYKDGIACNDYEIEWSIDNNDVLSQVELDIPLVESVAAGKEYIIVRGNKPGAATITATVNGEYSASFRLTVRENVININFPKYVQLSYKDKHVPIPDTTNDDDYAKELIYWINEIGLTKYYPEYSSVNDAECIEAVKNELLCQPLSYPLKDSAGNTFLIQNDQITVKEMMTYIIFASEAKKYLIGLENELLETAETDTTQIRILHLDYAMVTECFQNFYEDYTSIEKKLQNQNAAASSLLYLIAADGLIELIPNELTQMRKSWSGRFISASLSSIYDYSEEQKDQYLEQEFLDFLFLGVDSDDVDENVYSTYSNIKSKVMATKKLYDVFNDYFKNEFDDPEYSGIDGKVNLASGIMDYAADWFLDDLKKSDNPYISGMADFYDVSETTYGILKNLTITPNPAQLAMAGLQLSKQVTDAGKELYESAEKKDLGWYLLTMYLLNSSNELSTYIDPNTLMIQDYYSGLLSGANFASGLLESYITLDWSNKYGLGEGGFVTLPNANARKTAVHTTGTMRMFRDINILSLQTALVDQALANITEINVDDEIYLDTSKISEITYSETQTLADLPLPEGWKWSEETIVPTVSCAKYSAVYYKDGYNIERSVSIDVLPADAVLSIPSVSVKSGCLLSDAKLPDGWSWQNPAIKPLIGNGGYYADYTVNDYVNYDWTATEGYDPVSHTVTIKIPVTVNPIEVIIPTTDSSIFTYNGKEQTYTLVGSKYYTVSDNTTQINAGKYDILVTLNDITNTKWKDSTTADKTYVFAIGRATPSITVTAAPASDIAGKTVTVTATAINPNNKTLTDVPPVTLKYKVGENGTETEFIGSFVIPDGTANGTAITITATTAADRNYNAASATATVVVTDCAHTDVQTEWTTNGISHWHICNYCNAELDKAAHSGGTATCVDKAICEICGVAHGEIDSTNHTDIATEWSKDETGHWHKCNDCGTALDKTGHMSSGTATPDKAETCTICGYEIAPATKYVATPTFNSTSGTKFASTQVITIACATDGATIYYTTDGTDPTTASTEYTGEFAISKTTTVKAIAVKTGLNNSEIAEAKFTKKSSGGSSGGGGGGSRPSTSSTPSTTKYPKIDGKEISWLVVTSDVKKLTESGKLTVDLNGNTTVPTDVIAAIGNTNSVVTFKVSDKVSVTIDGAKVSGRVSAADMSVSDSTTNLSGYSFDVVGGTAESQKLIGEIGVLAKLNITLEKASADKFASMMKLNKTTGKMEFIDVAKVNADGTVSLGIYGKGDYVIVVDTETKKPGELNNDMKTNALDAAEVLKSIVYETPVNSFKADYNGDGTINAMDASAILKVVVGLIPDNYNLFG